MNYLKLIIAIISAVNIMQLYGSQAPRSRTTSSDSALAPRRATSAEERALFMGKLKQEAQERAQSPQHDIVDAITKLKNNTVSLYLNSSVARANKAGSMVTLKLSTSLTTYKQDLEASCDQERNIALAGTLAVQLADYKNEATKVSHIINSQEFKSLEVKCADFINLRP